MMILFIFIESLEEGDDLMPILLQIRIWTFVTLNGVFRCMFDLGKHYKQYILFIFLIKNNSLLFYDMAIRCVTDNDSARCMVFGCNISHGKLRF